jgi:hypothetical protein
MFHSLCFILLMFLDNTGYRLETYGDKTTCLLEQERIKTEMMKSYPGDESFYFECRHNLDRRS